MNDVIKVSIILPSFNVVRYIEMCLNSVLQQSLEEIELICVDAGSTDGTLEILQTYANSDKRIHLFMSERKSYGYQVNYGIDHSQGEYIAIVDTDDMVACDMYKSLYQVAIFNDADFVKADYCEFVQDIKGIQIQKEVSIVQADDLYDHVINVAKEQRCFHAQVTATWSGIYKRKFILENGIRHNETMGASYQDTGFWFQTYACAGRAYFVRQSFYKYRIDNPNSSVANCGKVFCICDEMWYIYGKLQEKGLFETFKDTFYYIFFRKYKRNMERIDRTYHMEFLERFSEDFNCLQSNAVCDVDLWTEYEKKEIKDILENPQNYYQNLLDKRQQFVSSLGDAPLIIYGVGKVGKALLHEVNDSKKILGFAISGKPSTSEEEEKPIKSIEEWTSVKDETTVIIAVKIKEYKVQMLESCQKCGFKNVVVVPDGLLDF